jgi:rod shape-determining protein MreB and related proteins
MDWVSSLLGYFSSDLAIDLGTANTLIHVKGKGLVLEEPSMVAISKKDGKVVAVGTAAKEMYGKTPENIKTIRPMKDGVIADFDVTKIMISHFIKQVLRKRSLIHPRMVISIPSGITAVEKRAVIDSADQAGARKVFLIEEPMAAAIGSNLPINGSKGAMVVDIGGGTTEVAVIASSAIAVCESIRVAGDEMDESIMHFMRHQYHLQIGSFEAEKIKIKIGSAFPQKEKLECQVRGRDIIDGTPKSMTISDDMIKESLNIPMMAILDSIRRTLDKTTPELSSDIYDSGIMLAGGGSLLRGLPEWLNKEIGLRFFLAEDPLRAIVRGSGIVLENFRAWNKVCVS